MSALPLSRPPDGASASTPNSDSNSTLAAGAWSCALELAVNRLTTSRPIERAVPETLRMADSTLSVLRSGSLSRAISSTCFFVTVPTLALLGSAEPLAMLAARLRSTGAGGVLVMNEYDRST